MKNFKISLLVGLGTLFLFGCANQPATTNEPTGDPQVAAINSLRAVMGLPNSPLESKGADTMINSPSGGLSVEVYVDSEGRRFSVEPQSNTVVEMDARSLLASISPNAPSVSQEDLKKKAVEIAGAVIPDFNIMQSGLLYDEGGKIDTYFFEWRKPPLPNQFMPPFFQIGFHKSGLIFAYINTLTLK